MAKTWTRQVGEDERLSRFPGLWEFLTSAYILGLFITAVLLHRMHNIVIPSPSRSRRAYRSPLQHTTFWERIHSIITPLDFSRTTTRLIFHLPSVYFLCKMLLVWGIFILQTCEVPLNFTRDQKQAYWGVLKWIEVFGRWCMKKDMAEVCWSTFCALCGASLVESFIRVLDGVAGSGFPLGGSHSFSSFHLFSYGFLLHIYSSPMAHNFYPLDESPSRPDMHVVITITIALLQLFIFHLLSISKRLSTHRLLPTALTSLLSLIHFHTAIYFYFTRKTGPATGARSPTNVQASGSPQQDKPYIAVYGRYPLLNYVPNIIETALLLIMCLTVFLNALVQLLIQGRIYRLFDGFRFINVLPNDGDVPNSWFANLPYEEDFFLVLLRIGMGILEATGLRGWNNEVATIQRPRINLRGRPTGRSEVGMPPYGRVKMGRLGVVQVESGSFSIEPSLSAGMGEYDDRTPPRRRKRRLLLGGQQGGFNNDVRIIDLGNTSNSGLFSGIWNRNLVAFWQFLVVLWGVIKGLIMFLLDKVRGRVRHSEQEKARFVVPEVLDREEGGALIRETKREWKEQELYRKFLHDEEISDDDEDAIGEGSALSSDDADEEDSGEDREAEDEAIGLFVDILRNGSPSRRVSYSSSSYNYASSGEVVLAHLVHGSESSSPLTRRNWNALSQGHQLLSNRRRSQPAIDDNIGPGTLIPAAYGREVEKRDKETELQHVCVVCMLEAREIICWPCRCLVVCDSCRETLASMTSATRHRCPCCRQIVEGYSRVFAP